jgi:pimeloyl-ACP methyl ester carboxylesterase
VKDLVFLHGGGVGSWCWTPLLAALGTTPARFSRMIALDMPGCGTKRGRHTENETLASITRALNDELRAANIHKAAFIGHSIAGVLMPMMAAADASLFSDLIYLQTSAPKEGQTIVDLMGDGLHGEDPERVGYALDFAKTPRREFYKTLFAVDFTPEQVDWAISEARQDQTPAALGIEPVTRKGYDPSLFRTAYILAKRDPLLPPVWQRRFAEQLGCARVIEIDTPHKPFISHPALLADTLRDLIAD